MGRSVFWNPYIFFHDVYFLQTFQKTFVHSINFTCIHTGMYGNFHLQLTNVHRCLNTWYNNNTIFKYTYQGDIPEHANKQCRDPIMWERTKIGEIWRKRVGYTVNNDKGTNSKQGESAWHRWGTQLWLTSLL